MTQDGEPSTLKSPERDGKPNIKFWLSQLEAARSAAKPSIDATRDAWAEYLGSDTKLPTEKGSTKQRGARNPVFWASIRMIKPGVYSRTPIPLAEKIFDSLPDPIARRGCIYLERLAVHLMRSVAFDRVQYTTCDHFLLGGRTTNRVLIESEVSSTPKKDYYTQTQVPGPDGQPQVVWVAPSGEPLQPDAELYQDEQGYYVESADENLEHVCVQLVPIHFEDILHTPNARHWEEIDWIAFRSLLTRREAEERFGKEIAADLKFSAITDGENENKAADNALPTEYATIWEIWDKSKKQVYWYCEGSTDDFVDIKDDPYNLVGFFPCPSFMLGTVGPDHLYAVPDYIQLKPFIDALHGLAERVRRLVKSTKRRGVFDASIPELKDLDSQAGEGEFIGVNNFAGQITGKGGLETVVQFFPVEKLVDAVQELTQVQQMYEDKFYESYGVPDILRGVSDPEETAAAQQQKGQFLSLRFSHIQKEFQRLNRDDIELMCDLALKAFPEEKLMDIMGVRLDDPNEQMMWPQVLALLRDDEERKIRIDIETDSTITMNQNAEIEQRSYLAKTLFEGLQAISQTEQSNRTMLPVAMQTLLYVVRGLQQGKQIEESLEQGLQAALQSQQPEPDPAMQKAQKDIQIAQVKAQADIAVQNAKTQADIYREDRKALHDMQLEQADAAHQQQLKQLEADLKLLQAKLSFALEGQKASNDSETKRMEVAVKAEQKPVPQQQTLHVQTAPVIQVMR